MTSIETADILLVLVFNFLVLMGVSVYFFANKQWYKGVGDDYMEIGHHKSMEDSQTDLRNYGFQK